MAVGNVQQVKACGICANVGHVTDMCPILYKDTTQDVNAIGFSGPLQRRYDPYSDTYNPGWRDHPNLNYATRPPIPQNFQFRPNVQQQTQPSSSRPGMSLEDIVKSLATNTQQFQQETRTSIQNLEIQMSQLATSLGRLESQGKLPSQTEVNPKQNASAITLRSGTELPEPARAVSREPRLKPRLEQEVSVQLNESNKKQSTAEQIQPLIIKPPFPERLAKSRRRCRGACPWNRCSRR
jgi:hypothetical protein